MLQECSREGICGGGLVEKLSTFGYPNSLVMNHVLTAFAFLVLFAGRGFSQVGVNTVNSSPDPSAMLDINAANKGLLIPRLTLDQIRTITQPGNSLLVFCTTDQKFYAFMADSARWKELLYGPGRITPTCGIPFTDVRDGRSYATIQIGTQCWMAQNLNAGTRIDNNYSQPNNSVIEKYCYNDLESNCDLFGGLYQWSEMMQYVTTPGVQGICPAGWHLPTDDEWMTMGTELGGLEVAGGKLKEAGTAHWIAPNTGATGESGMTALPGSYRGYLGGFGAPGERAAFWTSTRNTGASYNCSWNYDLFYNSAGAARQSGAMWSNGFSVRCVKN